ncbi:hypothetical protein NDU88_005769 [Pleurodeles waltl]|uniref:Uncharacterized protein n=1 Tax=Pleurodeles waltl TaxID=8319 RepID=A0AAV7TC09_PLEWA|nr:hypothetical protein NDU88_005769 [Pleurodeles waltl]
MAMAGAVKCRKGAAESTAISAGLHCSPQPPYLCRVASPGPTPWVRWSLGLDKQFADIFLVYSQLGLLPAHAGMELRPPPCAGFVGGVIAWPQRFNPHWAFRCMGRARCPWAKDRACHRLEEAGLPLVAVLSGIPGSI